MEIIDRDVLQKSGCWGRHAPAAGAWAASRRPGSNQVRADYWYVMPAVETPAGDEVASSTSGRARSVVGNTVSVTVAPFAAVAERTQTPGGRGDEPLTLMVPALTRAA